jgi:cell division ATPase FtsA
VALVVSSGSGSNAAINYKKNRFTLTAVYNAAVEQISNDIAK